MTRLWRRRKDDIPGRSLTSVDPPSPDEAGRHSAFLEHAQEAMILVEGGAVHWLNPAATLMFPGLDEPVGWPPLLATTHGSGCEGIHLPGHPGIGTAAGHPSQSPATRRAGCREHRGGARLFQCC